MKPDLSHLLTELYSADPSLKEHEKVLKPILNKLITARPNVTIDEQFKAKLREEVWQKIEAAEQKRSGLPKWAFAFGGAALTALILVPSFLVTSGGKITSDMSIQNTNEEKVFTESDGIEDAGRGGGGGMRDSSDDEIVEEDAYLDYIPYTTFTYAYEGDTLILDGASTEAFTRDFPESEITVEGWLSDLEMDLVDLSSFEDMKMSYLTIEPVDDAGYSISFDAANSMITFSYWDEDSWESEWDYSSSSKRISQDRALEIAEEFITEHDLDMSNFGKPIVDDPHTYNGYIDSYATITYPIEQNGLVLYDSWGSPEGIMITVSVEHERVDSLWGLAPQDYETSIYDTITDEGRVIEIAEGGGYNNYIDPYADNIVELDLGTPFEALTKIYDYNGDYIERLVPALIFPVEEYHVDNYTDYIVVPLIEEFLGDEYPDEPTHYIQEEAVEEAVG
jgi:hypothetical protein